MNYVPPIKDGVKIEAMKEVLHRQSYRNYIIFILAINYGRRITDILKMKVGDIRGKEYLTVPENKTGKHIPLKINQQTRFEVMRYAEGMDDGQYLFPSKKRSDKYPPDCKGYTPVGRVQVWNDIKTAAIECGIPDIGTHSLRKTFGYHLYKQTGDIALVQKIFGHQTQLDTLRYIGMEQEYIDKATTALSL